MVEGVLLTSCSNIYKLQSSIHSNILGNEKWDMVVSPLPYMKEGAACSYTFIQTRN